MALRPEYEPKESEKNRSVDSFDPKVVLELPEWREQLLSEEVNSSALKLVPRTSNVNGPLMKWTDRGQGLSYEFTDGVRESKQYLGVGDVFV
jgi:hypothetical protein